MKTVIAFFIFLLVTTVLSIALEKTPPIKQFVIVKHDKPYPIFRVTGTYYNPVEAQCDSRPLETADGSTITRGVRWIAVSRDLLKEFSYGDSVYVYHPNPKIEGWYEIHDTMNKRFKRRIDFVQWGNDFPGLTKGILISKVKFI